MYSRIVGTGRYLPSRVVTNDDMSKMVPTNDEWIQQRTGVKERRFAAATGDTTAEMGARAAQEAIQAAGLKPSDIDFMICATQTPQAMFPGTACFIQKILDNPTIGALDVRNQCTGFLYGLSIADAYVRLGTYRRVLLVGAEMHSTGLEYSEHGRHVTVLFGDGAGAVVLGPSEKPGIRSIHLHADGRFATDLMVEGPGAMFNPQINHQLIEEGRHFPKMNGKVVFVEAVTQFTNVVQEALRANGMSIKDIDLFIPHQANLRITESVCQRLGFPMERTDTSITRYGNCAAASVPIALDEQVRTGKIQPGMRILFATFAAGFTWGGAIVDW